MPSTPSRPLRILAALRRAVAVPAGVVATCVLGAPVAAQSSPTAPGAASSDIGRVDATPVRTRLGFERVDLPDGETMGLTGLGARLALGADLWAGVAVYGATTGRRGGLFVPGVDVAWAPSLGAGFSIDAGVFAGGGGGGNAPVGGGLMVRPHVDLLWQGPGFRTGPSLSQVRFPMGDIRSTQVGWIVEFDSRFVCRDAEATPFGAPTDARGPVADALGFQHIDATLTRYRPRHGSTRLDDGRALGDIDLVGMRAERDVAPWLRWGVEAAGAARGGVAGYAEVLGTLGLRWPLADGRVAVALRGAVGLGGGGAVDTGGGVLVKGAAGVTWRVTDTWGVGLEGGIVRAPGGGFSATTGAVSLDWVLDPVAGGPREAGRMTWVTGVERYDAARRDGSTRPLEAVVLGIERFVTPAVYLTGQAHSAFGGGAGAYSVGLFGVGAQVPVAARLRLGGELLAGAAGGGGVDTAGGALLQGRGYVDVALDRTLSLRLGVGRVKSVHGGLDATAVDTALVVRFGVDRPGRR